jgi:7-cyano-7-deazaguanine synthase
VKPRRAVCLVSGGLDSAVAGTIAKCERYCLTVDYGQKHARELEAARQVAEALRAKEHKVVKIPLADFGGSALTTNDPVPKGRSAEEIANGIPPTYVPARNTVFLSLALAWAETLEADAIFIGAHAVDYSGYPDCRPEYIEAFQGVAKLATKRAVEGKPPKIFAPLISWDKSRIIETGFDLRAPLAKTWSCYEEGPSPCGACDACQIRERAFMAVGRKDPALDGAAAMPSAAPKPAPEPKSASRAVTKSKAAGRKPAKAKAKPKRAKKAR